MSDSGAGARRRVAMLLHKSVERDSRVRRAASALARAGHDVVVVDLPPEPRGGEARLDGFRVRSASPPRWVRERVPFHAYRVLFLASFVRALMRERPDVVHAHDAAMLLPGYLGARLVGARLVYDSHELATGVPYRERMWASLVRLLERAIVPRCDGVVTVSDGIAERLRELYGLAEPPVVVRNIPELRAGGGPPGGRAGGLRARLGVGDAPLVLHQGALAPRRGCEQMVRAMLELPDAHLAFLGDAWPGYAGEIEGLVRALSLERRVHFVPSVPVERLLAWTGEADVGVSLLDGDCENHRLALPNKVFEYVAAGVPVVASDLPELRALVDREGIGRCCAPDDPTALAAAIRDVLARNGALTSTLDRARRTLAWEVEQRQLTDLYEHLAEGRDRGRALVLVRNGVTHDARVRREADALRRLGYRPTIIGVLTAREPAPRETLDGVAVLRLDPGGVLRRLAGGLRGGAPPVDAAVAGSSSPARGRPAGTVAQRLRRLAVTLDWYRQCIGVVLRNQAPLVHCNDYNTMWIGVAAKLLCRSRVVYDAHELWPDRNLRPEPRRWLLACEWLFVRVADRVLTTSPAYADLMARRYRVAAPTVVRNVPSYAVTASSASASRTDGRRRAVYFGAITSGRGLERAVAALVRIEDLELRLVGPEAWGFTQRLDELARRLGVRDRLELAPPVAPADAPAVFADADVGLALIEPVCLSYRLTLPNKLFEYMAAGLPVVASDLPAMAAVVGETGAGVTVDPSDAASVERGLREALEPDRNAQLRAAARAAAERVTWEAERRVLARAYDDAMAGVL